MKVLPILALTLMLTCVPAFAGPLHCSVHPPAGASARSLLAMTKVTRTAARQTAMSGYARTQAHVSEGELEAEDGCLVYSFDIRVHNRPGVDEILVDAGTGKVLDHQHETSKQETDEAAAERRPAAG